MSLLSTLSRRTIYPASRLISPTFTKILDERINTATQVTRRQFSTQDPQKYIVINSHGLDRPGIVADITQIVTDKGGNVGESQAQLLGGHFALMMLVQIQSSDVDSLSKQLQENVKGMSTSVFDAISPKKADMSPKIGFAGHFKLSGADNLGIVHKLTSVLVRNSLTIGNMKTSNEDAPFGGSSLFTMEGIAIAYEPLATNFDWKKIRQELQDMGDSMNCDVEFEDNTK